VTIRYDMWYAAWETFLPSVTDLIRRENARTICEVGGGANPALPLDFVREKALDYVVVDVSEEELAKAPTGYTLLCADVTSPTLEISDQYDLVFSRMVAEHTRRGEDFHRNIFELLEPNGVAFHFFPTLYALLFLVNRLLPPSSTERLLGLLQEGREKTGKHAKFRAYYSWCRGPLKSQIRRFERLGYSVEEYVGFFGHGYLDRVRPVQSFYDAMASLFIRHPVPLFTTFAHVTLRKPRYPLEALTQAWAP
jgi:uncharacterized UPF0146 family protein